MSDPNQIRTALNRRFHEEGQRVVFWNDPDQDVFHERAAPGTGTQ